MVLSAGEARASLGAGTCALEPGSNSLPYCASRPSRSRGTGITKVPNSAVPADQETYIEVAGSGPNASQRGLGGAAGRVAALAADCRQSTRLAGAANPQGPALSTGPRPPGARREAPRTGSRRYPQGPCLEHGPAPAGRAQEVMHLLRTHVPCQPVGYLPVRGFHTEKVRLPRPPRLVHGDHAHGQVSPAHAAPAGGGYPPGELGLGGPLRDRLRQIAVRLAAPGHPAGDHRQSRGQVPGVDRVEPARRQVAELAHHQPAPRPGYPEHLVQGGVRVNDIAEPERDRHRVEGEILEREGERIPGHEADPGRGLGGTGPQPAEGEVAGATPPPGAGERARRGAGTGGDVEHPLAGPGGDPPGP